jgi:hypothetical protein
MADIPLLALRPLRVPESLKGGKKEKERKK